MKLSKVQKHNAILYNKPDPKISNLCEIRQIVLTPPKTLIILIKGFFL